MDRYIFKSPVGLLEICEENSKLTNLSLLKGEAVSAGTQDFKHHSDFLYEAYRQLNEYFSGTRRSFELALESKGTEFQRAVWRELQKIPYGETRSYEDIAVGIGKPKAVRAIGQANSRNPIMIIVPCHRVVHKNGDIAGFAGGIEAKKYLLELESRNYKG